MSPYERIAAIERKQEDQEKRLEKLESLRTFLSGMGTAAVWGLRVVYALGGWKGIEIVGKFIHWMNAPIGRAH